MDKKERHSLPTVSGNTPTTFVREEPLKPPRTLIGTGRLPDNLFERYQPDDWKKAGLPEEGPIDPTILEYARLCIQSYRLTKIKYGEKETLCGQNMILFGNAHIVPTPINKEYRIYFKTSLDQGPFDYEVHRVIYVYKAHPSDLDQASERHRWAELVGFKDGKWQIIGEYLDIHFAKNRGKLGISDYLKAQGWINIGELVRDHSVSYPEF